MRRYETIEHWFVRADLSLEIVPPDARQQPKIAARNFTLQKLAKVLSGSHWIKSEFRAFGEPLLFTFVLLDNTVSVTVYTTSITDVFGGKNPFKP